MQCPGCRHANFPKARFCEACGTSLARPMPGGEPTASYADLERVLNEALEQQAATSEILRMISRSPTDVQPVFDAIVRSAQALTATATSAVFIVAGDEIAVVAAADGVSPHEVAEWRAQYPRVPTPDTVMGRAILERQAVHAKDLETDPRYQTAPGRLLGVRTILGVPMLRDGHAIGVIAVWRLEVKPFSDKQIELLQTFADQAVIAIENVRLFKELEARNRDLTEALEQQTATGEILGVISASPTDLQPVLGAVVRSAARFCGADDASIFRLDGQSLRADAHHGPVPQFIGVRVPVVRGTVGGRTVLERRPIHVADLQAETEEFPEGSTTARQVGHRTTLSVPLLREGTAIGVIMLRRANVDLFTDKQVGLLQTFADQAVIAIENVRLFRELEVANRELGAASRHKSEFLANMSHELRTHLRVHAPGTAMAGELILIVEDNDKSRKLVRDVLTFKRYEVIESETGEEGIRLALERCPSLVLMDIRLPGIDGVEALRRLRAEGTTRGIPVGHDRVGDDRGPAEDSGGRIRRVPEQTPQRDGLCGGSRAAP